MKKILFALPLCLAITLTSTAQRGMLQGMQKLLNAEYAIASLYVDTVNEDKLIEEAIKGMLESLDPHSSYTDAKETMMLFVITGNGKGKTTSALGMVCRTRGQGL